VPRPLRAYPGGYRVPKGWQPVVMPVLDQLEEACVEIYACREHYGTLKLVVRDCPEWVLDVIRSTRAIVNSMCEDCGQPGTLKVSRNGHLKTCCANHPPEVFHHRRDRDNFWDL